MAAAPLALTQECIPDTPPNVVDCPGTSAATAAVLRAANDSTVGPLSKWVRVASCALKPTGLVSVSSAFETFYQQFRPMAPK